VKFTEYYPLLLFCVGTSDKARSSLKSIKREYRAPGVAVTDSGVQVVFSSVFPVKGNGFERASQIRQINKWLQNWCHIQGFGYLDHGTRFEKPGLLGAGGMKNHPL